MRNAGKSDAAHTAEVAAAKPGMSEEMKASMGLPSTFHTANTNPVPEPAGYHPDKAMPLGEHLRNILGTAQDKPPQVEPRVGPEGKGVMQAVDEAVQGVKAAPTPDMDH